LILPSSNLPPLLAATPKQAAAGRRRESCQAAARRRRESCPWRRLHRAVEQSRYSVTSPGI
jgi:hypothetical protein